MDKAEKIAAARKKLKEFQKNKGVPNDSVSQKESNHNENKPPPQVTNNGPEVVQSTESEKNTEIQQLKNYLEYYANQYKQDVEKLQNDLKSHADMIRILVQEKSDLQRNENTMSEKIGELESRLAASRSKVKDLESQLRNQPVATPQVDVQAIVNDFERKIQLNDEEKSELKEKLNQKLIELENLQKNFDHLTTELHIRDVKIAQLSDTGNNETPVSFDLQHKIDLLTQENLIKQQQIDELNKSIVELNKSREVSENQYQNYVTHLSREQKSLKETVDQLTAENNELLGKQQNLVQHISALERQIQSQITKQHSIAASNENFNADYAKQTIEQLTSQVKILQEENGSLIEKVKSFDEMKLLLEKQIEEKTLELNQMELDLEKARIEQPNFGKLMVDMESDKVAASRAVTQNQSLKEQLEEMQRAFIQVSNDKLEVTDKLQTEMHLCKEMRTRNVTVEVELRALQEKWRFKEEEMIRLSHEITEMQKKLLQQSVELDRLRHYESKGLGHESIIEKELEHSKRLIDTLTNKINILESQRKQLDHGHSHSHEHDHDEKCDSSKYKDLMEEIDTLKMEKSELLKIINKFQAKNREKVIVETESKDVGSAGDINVDDEKAAEMNEETLKELTEVTPTPSIATEEALEKLQERFRRTMLEVADLSEEKLRLEHLVTQLQFETETIGEYITLYQYQRRLLKQKDYERDIQLKNLAADREKLNEKLVQLNKLIEMYVLQHNNNSNPNANRTELMAESNRIMGTEGVPTQLTKMNGTADSDNQKSQTAERILEILSDIKTTNAKSYDPNSSSISVEHCACCMGKLETV